MKYGATDFCLALQQVYTMKFLRLLPGTSTGIHNEIFNGSDLSNMTAYFTCTKALISVDQETPMYDLVFCAA